MRLNNLADYKKALLEALRKALGGFDKEDADKLSNSCISCPLAYVEALLDALEAHDIGEDRLGAVARAFDALDAGQEIDAFAILGAGYLIEALQGDLRDSSLMDGDTQHFKDEADRDLRENGLGAKAIQWAKDVPDYDAYLVLSASGRLSIYEDESEAIREKYGIPTIARCLRWAFRNA